MQGKKMLHPIEYLYHWKDLEIAQIHRHTQELHNPRRKVSYWIAMQAQNVMNNSNLLSTLNIPKYLGGVGVRQKVCLSHESWRVELKKDKCRLELEIGISFSRLWHKWVGFFDAQFPVSLKSFCFLFFFFQFFTSICLIWNIIYDISPLYII